MIQVILNYPQAHTDMVLENIPTLPIEHHSGRERTVVDNGNSDDRPEDSAYTSIMCYEVRLYKHLPEWRQHREE